MQRPTKGDPITRILEDAWDQWETECATSDRTNTEILESMEAFKNTFISVQQKRLLSLALKRNRQSRILALPIEVLTRIFHYRLGLSNPWDWKFEELTTLASVTKAFAAILRSSYFWPTLRVDSPPDVSQAVLARNSTGPLTILVSGTPAYSVARLSRFLELATPHQTRWQRLRWRTNNCWDNISSILAGHMPSLIYLDMDWMDESSYSIAAMGLGPCLVHLELSNVKIPWNSPRLSNIRLLRLSYSDETCIPSAVQLVTLLNASPNLDTILLDFDFEYNISSIPDIPSCKTIHLPQLSAIQLLFAEPYGLFLASRLLSSSCRRYSLGEVDVSLFDSKIGSNFLHTLESVIRGLGGLDIRYSGPDSELILWGLSYDDLILDRNHHSINPTFLMEVTPTQSFTDTSWQNLCKFLKLQIRSGTYVRLTSSGPINPDSFPDLCLLGLFKGLDVVHSLHLTGTQGSLSFLEAICPVESPEDPPLATEFSSRWRSLKCLTIQESVEIEKQKGTVILSNFIQSVLSHSDPVVNSPSQNGRIPDLVFRHPDRLEPLLEYIASGRVEQKPVIRSEDKSFLQELDEWDISHHIDIRSR